MQERLLYTYILAKSLHEQDRDILDIFVPFVLSTFSLVNNCNYLEQFKIKQSLKNNYQLEIPSYTLGTIITRAKRKKYLKQDHGRLYLTEKGNKVQKEIAEKRDIERENNFFINNLHKYFKSKGFKISKEEVSQKLMTIINANLCSWVTYLGEEPQKTNCSEINKLESREIINFFKEIEKSDTKSFNILKNIIMGSIICTMVKKDQSILKTEMKPCKVFLDTNLVFSLLGYHYPEVSIPVQELIDLLKQHKYKLYIFSFTIQEVARVLANYKKNYLKYSSLVKVNSIYNRLKQLGKTPSEVTEIIANLERIMEEKRINIYPVDTDKINISEDSIEKLRKYKENSHILSLEHDLYAIKIIKKIRRYKVRKLEKAGVIFLTSDQRLTQYNFEEDQHKINSTINEVILDRLMTNVLWFKNPNLDSNLPLYSVLSLYANNLFVDNEIWKRFYSVLKKMKDENELTDDDFSVMLYNDRIEEELLNFDEEIEDIDEIFIEELVEKSKLLYQEREKIFKLQQKENKNLLEGNQQVIETIQNIKSNIYLEANKKANRYNYILQYVIIPGLLVGISYWLWQKPWSNFIVFLISVIGFFINFVILPKFNLKITLNRYFIRKLNKKFLGDYDMSEINDRLLQVNISSSKKDDNVVK